MTNPSDEPTKKHQRPSLEDTEVDMSGHWADIGDANPEHTIVTSQRRVQSLSESVQLPSVSDPSTVVEKGIPAAKITSSMPPLVKGGWAPYTAPVRPPLIA